jgi:hypothetical protein
LQFAIEGAGQVQAIKWDGKTISKPGIYSGIPLEIYHSQKICDDPSVSSTGLRRVLEVNGGSPAHFYDEWSGNPNCAEPEDKPHFMLGRAAHFLFLEGSKRGGAFSKSFAIRPDEFPDYRTAAAREWRDDQIALGKMPLTDEHVEVITGMAKRIATEQIAISLLRGDIERSLFWKDSNTGLWLKARPDVIPNDSGDFSDLKTTTRTSFPLLMHAVGQHAYHQQAALIREASAIVLGLGMTSFSLVFVESKRPYCVRIVVLDPRDIDLGQRQNRRALDLIAACIKAKRWPGPGDGHIVTIPLTEKYRESAEPQQ